MFPERSRLESKSLPCRVLTLAVHGRVVQPIGPPGFSIGERLGIVPKIEGKRSLDEKQIFYVRKNDCQRSKIKNGRNILQVESRIVCDRTI